MFYRVRLNLFITIIICVLFSSQAMAFPFKTDTNKTPTAANGNVFIKAVTSKNNVFVGEPFVVKYQFYYVSFTQIPDNNFTANFANCFQEDLNTNHEAHEEIINGIKYTVVVLKQYLVIAKNHGIVEIPKIRVQLKTSFLDTTAFFPVEKTILKSYFSNKNSITVKPLPVNADTALFCGAIGNFKISGSYHTIKKNKNMLFFQLFIDGIGYTKSTLITNPPFPQGLEVYNVNTIPHDTITPDGIKTHLEYSFQLVANYKGKYTVPGVSFTVFNLDKGKYEKFNSGNFVWDVENGPTLASQTKIVPLKANDFFTKDTLVNNAKQFFYASFLFKFLLLIGFLLLVYIYQMAFFNKLFLKYIELIKLKINKYETIKSINKLIIESSSLENDEFWKSLNRIFFTYFRKEAKIDDTTVSDLSINLQQYSDRLPEGVYIQIDQFLFNLQSVRFSALPLTAIDKVKSCDQLVKIVNAIDSNWHE